MYHTVLHCTVRLRKRDFEILWLKHTTYIFLLKYNSRYIKCTCKKREVISSRNPHKNDFQVCTVNPGTSRGPTRNFATCRDIARTLTAKMGLASSQKYKMQQLHENRTFSMISTQYKMQRGVLHVTVRRGRALLLNNSFRNTRPRPVTLMINVNAHDDRVMIRHSRSLLDSQCGASKILRKVVPCAPCLQSAVKTTRDSASHVGAYTETCYLVTCSLRYGRAIYFPTADSASL